MSVTVIMTGAGAPGMPGILTCLKSHRHEMRLIGLDMDANAPSRQDFDAFYVIPAAKDDAFLPTLLDIVRKEKADIVVPVVTRELHKCAEAREQFAALGAVVAVMDADKVDLANDKGLLLTAMREAGMPVPDFCLADDLDELGAAFDKLGYPEKAVCVKAVVGNGSRAVRLIDPNVSKSRLFFDEKPNGMYMSRHDLWEALAEREKFPVRMMVMQYLPGREYSVDIVAKDGRVQAALARCGLQVVSSNQTMSQVVDAPEVIDICRRVVETFGLGGNIGFDLKEDENGTPYVLEINPRLTGGIVTCLAGGANMPWLGIQSWLGAEVQQPKLRYGVRMQRFWNERFYDENGQRMTVG